MLATLADLTTAANLALDLHERAIADIDRAGRHLREAGAALGRLQRDRANQKAAAKIRLMKDHRFTDSQANDLAQLDPDYAVYKARVADAEQRRQARQTDYDTALALVKNTEQRAKLAVTLVRAHDATAERLRLLLAGEALAPIDPIPPIDGVERTPARSVEQ